MTTGIRGLMMLAWLLATILFSGLIVRAHEAEMQRRVNELKNLKWGMFVCWSFSTFSDKEWTPGIKEVSFFNPTGLDTDQWAATAREAGMGYILFLTKHHDGFCLWDTRTTERKVTNSPLGKDVLAAVKKSCDRFGLKLALYFSEGDWTWPEAEDGKSGKGGANPQVKKAQLHELLTNYGPIEFIWFDHAVGTGGLSHRETAEFVKKLQPGCFVGYNHGEPAGDLRLGEMGRPSLLSDPSGAGFNKDAIKGYSGYQAAEFTMPILMGTKAGRWFYTSPRNDRVAMPATQIYQLYREAQRYGNIFSLDVGPDRAGKLREIDVQTLREVGRMIRGEFR
jgi:alpha-L-fucosidase